MAYQTYNPFSPSDTPKSITFLIFITAIATVFCAAVEPLFVNVFKMTGPQEFFGLSRWGISNSYYWQYITSLFIQVNVSGIGIFFLLSLTFNMYMLWLFGTNLVEAYGSSAFLRFYLLSGFVAGVVAILTMRGVNEFRLIGGPAPALLATFVAWAFLHKDTQLYLFFMIPIQVKLLLAVVVGLAILIPLSELDTVILMYNIAGILMGYLYSTVIWSKKSPFRFLESVDEFFVELGSKLRVYINRWNPLKKKENKIVDIKTGKAVLDDDAFMDEMLAKISRYGEQSLTWQEKDRMKKISEKKMKKS